MKRYVLLAIALCFLAIYLFPLYWMYLTAFKPSSETFTFPPSFWPSDPQFNFAKVFVEKKMDTYLWNSLLIATGTTALAAFFGTGCAYALARFRNVWIDIVLFLILMMQV
ncbi:MAG: carbohydrate ABC transporter permease, partial [Rhizobiales bacterium]|nr:carbohydrate ABC transporter permease [Hyphomicrobiales bacterium]